MEALDAVIAASFETTAFLDHFKDLPDRRQAGKVMYPLDGVLLLSLLAVLAGAEGFTDIARFGEEAWLAAPFPSFADGTPSHDHLGDIFATLDAQGFRRCLRGLGGGVDPDAGRTHRHRRQDVAALRQERDRRKPSTWCRPSPRASAPVLAQTKVGEKSEQGLQPFPLSSTCCRSKEAARHHRRDRMPARHRPADHRQESRLHSGAEG